MGRASSRSLGRAVLLAASVALAPPATGGTSRAEAARERVRLEPPADWVQLDWPEPSAAAGAEAAGGLRHLLLERQVNGVDEPLATWIRHVRQVTGEEGIPEVSKLELRLDPSYEELGIHHVRVLRDGEWLDRLDRDRLEFLQRESSLEGQLYDGVVTVLLLLEDVRVGDVVDHSFTRRGRNPAWGRHWFDRVELQWSRPVDRFRWRSIWPRAAAPRHRLHRTELEPAIIEHGGLREIVWSRVDVPAMDPPGGLPPWVNPWPILQLSDFRDWSEVVGWARLQFPDPPDELPPALASLVDPLREDRALERARRALRLVQDDVRYLGIEFGPKAYRPAPALEVWRRRFGDCKDKSVLLVWLLRALDLDARVALVHSSRGLALIDDLPSPGSFNHAIVRLRIGERSYWLDPTRLHERGPLDRRFVPDLGWALVIAEGVRELERVEPQGHGKTRVEETYRSSGTDSPAAFIVRTTYSGRQADAIRGTLARTPREELLSSYVDYYSSTYPGMSSNAPLEVSDDERLNLVTVRESYVLPQFWNDGAEPGRIVAEIWPLQLDSLLSLPATTERDLPLTWRHPVVFEQLTRIELHEDWPAEEESELIGSAGFVFRHARTAISDTITIEQVYESHAAAIEPADLLHHHARLERARDKLGLSI